MTTLDMDEKRKRPIRKKVLIRLLLVLLSVCVVGVAAFSIYSFYKSRYGTYDHYDVITTVEKGGGTSVDFKSYNGLLLKYSRDGATAMSESGEFLWNGSYEMKDPIVDTCGDYVAIADRGSKLVHIFNGSGPVNNITVDFPILQVQVANQGMVAVMMEAENVAYINIYRPKGTVNQQIIKPIELAGFPLSMALSNDGSRLVFSFLDVTSGTVKTNIACHNFDEVGQNEENNFVGGFIYEGVIAKVDFINNEIVCFYNEDGFTLYRFDERLAQTSIADVQFEEQVNSIFSTSQYVGFVLDSSEENSKYKVLIYDVKGSKVLEEDFNFDYSGIHMNGSEIVFYNYSECKVMNVKGNIRFQYQFEEGIDAMFVASSNKYYVVHSNEIEVICLKGAK